MSGDDGTHQCPAGECQRRISLDKLMCREHWFMVSRPMRAAVLNAWAAGLGAGSPEHRAACLAAIRSVNKTLENSQ